MDGKTQGASMHFQKVFSVNNRGAKNLLETILKMLRNITIYWFSYMEDLEGAADCAELRYCTSVMLLETIIETDILMDDTYNQTVAQEHHLAIALENGLTNITCCSGEELLEHFALDSLEAGSQKVLSFCHEMIRGLSTSIPSPMGSSSSLNYIKALKHWVTAMKQTGLPPQFLEDVYLRK